MDIEEAIEHAENRAGDCATDCRREHRQLAEWLRELLRLRLYIDAMHGKGDVRHDYNGLCPDETQPDSRDDECPACTLLTPNALAQGPGGSSPGPAGATGSALTDQGN